MIIIQINTFGNHSTGNIACKNALELEQQGNKCYVAYARGTIPSNIKSYKIESKASVYLHGIFARLFDSCGFHSTIATIKLVKWIKRINPDIIHLHALHGYYINIRVLFKFLKKFNGKILWTQHDCWNFTGHCAYFYKADCDKWKKICYNCPLKKEFPKSYFDFSKRNFLLKKKIFTQLNRKTTKIIVPSNWLRMIVNDSFLNCYEIVVQYNQIDESIFKYTESDIKDRLQIKSKKIVLGVATCWDERKGLKDYLELSRILTDDYIIVLVGLSKEQILNINEYDNIIGLPKTNTLQELAELYSAADIYFSASNQETFGMTFLEAQKCGCKTIIGYNVSAIPEILNYVGGITIDFDENRVCNVAKIIKKC